MKKITLLTTVFLLFMALAVNAQQRNPREKMTPEQQSTKMVERLNNELTLNAKQQADLKTFFTTSFKKRNESFEKNKNNRDAMRESIKKNREETDVQLKKVLTADQYKKYKENEEKKIQERKGKGGRPGQGQPQR